tara:strand:- start:545 stop:1084 length:540 start_codon:yes stop_codon:yes gene_type:complete
MSDYFYQTIDNFVKQTELDSFWENYVHNGKISLIYTNGLKEYGIDSFCTGLTQQELMSIPFIENSKIKIDTLIKTMKQQFVRIFINAQSSGYDGMIHHDNIKDSLTALLFVNPTWENWWGGEFILYNEDGSEILNASTCKPGRLVIFSSHLKHRGIGPAQITKGVLRVSIAFQYQKIIC